MEKGKGFELHRREGGGKGFAKSLKVNSSAFSKEKELSYLEENEGKVWSALASDEWEKKESLSLRIRKRGRFLVESTGERSLRLSDLRKS